MVANGTGDTTLREGVGVFCDEIRWLVLSSLKEGFDEEKDMVKKKTTLFLWPEEASYVLAKGLVGSAQPIAIDPPT